MMRLFKKKHFQDCIPRSIDPRELVLISGAGIAGLTAALKLLARGFKVLIVEKRTAFNRSNVVNLDVEAKRFLEEFGLLDEFENVVAGKISTFRVMLAENKSMREIDYSDVSPLKPTQLPFEPEFFNDLFKNDGFYSVRISDLQKFLASKVIEGGARLLGNAELDVLGLTPEGGAAEVRITGNDELIQPKLLIIAEGAHSQTAQNLGMETKEVKNECSGENWVFGNLKYSGTQNFVVSVIDPHKGGLELVNIIFNARIHKVNVAVNSKKSLSQEQIQKKILRIARRVFSILGFDEQPQALLSCVSKPVNIKNEKRVTYSQGNVFCVGDTAGHSSPLAAMGATLGVTLVPRAVEKVLNDLEHQPSQTHQNFQRFTDAYVDRWIGKAGKVKERCLFFKSKQTAASGQELKPSKARPLTRTVRK